MKKKTKKKVTKHNFIQDTGIYDYVFNVYVGFTKDEIKTDLIRYKDVDDMMKRLDDCKWDVGGFILEDDLSKRILWMPTWKGKWHDISNLSHELHHMTFLLAKQKGFLEEIESTAYLFQYLLDNVYRKISNPTDH